MDSKQVTKEINSIIRPMLKSNGFNKFSGRTYWRYKLDRIDILNFQSFNSYNAEILGCTTFSFSVNLATFLNYIQSDLDIKEQNGLKRPKEYEGHFRSKIFKGINQDEFKREDIWLINEDEENLKNSIIDCKNQIEKNAFNWYNQFDDKEKALNILLKEQENMNGTWGFGNFNSPRRNEFTAYTALELNNKELAKNKFNEVISFYNERYNEIKDNRYQKVTAEKYLEKIKNIQQIIKDTE